MSLLKKNIAANFVGSIWQILMGLMFIPLYIRFLGIESWGLVGFVATLTAIFNLLDLGLTNTLNREMARLSVLSDREADMHNLVRTLEIIYWSIAIMVGITIILLSPVFTSHWIKAKALSMPSVKQSFFLMSFIITFQMTISFYSGGLLGLQRIVLLNILRISMSTLQGVGAVLILWLISPTIQAFFLWYIVINMTYSFLLVYFVWRSLPVYKNRAVFSMGLLKKIWKFAAGISAIAILATILTQLDKVILSRMLSLEMFGYYTLASMVSLTLVRFVLPVFFSLYPRFTQLVSLGDEDGLNRLYHQSCQFMSVLILPLAIIIVLFSYEILLIWTQDKVIALQTHRLLSILTCGTAINGVMYLPFALQLAFGWTKLSILKNVLAVILFIPAVIYMTKVYGGIGAASVWLVLNLAYIIFEIPIMHARLLKDEQRKWYCLDVLFPLAVIILISSLGRALIKSTMSPFMLVFSLGTLTLLVYGVVIIVTPATREWTYKYLITMFKG